MASARSSSGRSWYSSLLGEVISTFSSDTNHPMVLEFVQKLLERVIARGYRCCCSRRRLLQRLLHPRLLWRWCHGDQPDVPPKCASMRFSSRSWRCASAPRPGWCHIQCRSGGANPRSRREKSYQGPQWCGEEVQEDGTIVASASSKLWRVDDHPRYVRPGSWWTHPRCRALAHSASGFWCRPRPTAGGRQTDWRQ